MLTPAELALILRIGQILETEGPLLLKVLARLSPKLAGYIAQAEAAAEKAVPLLTELESLFAAINPPAPVEPAPAA